MSEHTAGPWKQYEGYGSDFRRPIITDLIPDKDGKCMANCICYVATTNGDWDANARLIAAAPELLEALEDCEFILYGCGLGPKAQEKARAAIKKARGE